MKTKLLATLALTTLLIGCNDTPTEEVKTVDYYEQNKKALELKMKECKNNPGELKETPNCQNAIQAMKNNSSGKPVSGDWGKRAAESYIKNNLSK